MHVSTAPIVPDRARVVVIGAGIAGLSTSLRLASAGLQVTLLERHAHAGGKIRTVPSAAGPVDAGPTVLTLRHVFDDLFAAADTKLEDHVTLIRQDILARHFWPDGSSLDLYADLRRSLRAIAGFAGPKSAQEFANFNARTRRLFAAFDKPMMQAAEPRLTELVMHVLRHPRLIPAMDPTRSLSQSLARQFSDPRLAQLFGRYATYVGGNPLFSPALLSLIWRAEASGVWVVEGGMHKLAEAIAELGHQKGVVLHHNCHVAEILMSDDGVCGVRTKAGDTIDADAIVYAGDPRALATGDLGPGVTGVASQTLTLPRSLSARVYSFAAQVSGPALSHHNVFFAADPASEFTDLAAGRIPRDPTLYLCAEDRGQTTSPPRVERFEIIANAPADDTDIPPQELSQWHHQIMQRMADSGVTFTPTPDLQSLTTPQQFARLFPQTLGALYGQTPHGMTAAFKRPSARTQIPRLYLAGGGTHPGAGVPMATLSGRHAAEAILHDLTSTSTLRRMATHGGTSTG